jgi:ChaB
MPRTSRSHNSGAGEMPGTLRRSSTEAQQMFAHARDSAVSTYGEGDEAQRVAYATLKEKFEKRGDHWIAKVPDPADSGD